MSVLRILRNLAVLVILAMALLASTPRRAAAKNKKLQCLPAHSTCYFYAGAEPCCTGEICQADPFRPGTGVCLYIPF